uniref:Uncharacterized protein n=1 Tax=Panagrolaimus sp. ES5 TaxID=591445 RepID=A0AC34FY28_9BILA
IQQLVVAGDNQQAVPKITSHQSASPLHQPASGGNHQNSEIVPASSPAINPTPQDNVQQQPSIEQNTLPSQQVSTGKKVATPSQENGNLILQEKQQQPQTSPQPQEGQAAGNQKNDEIVSPLSPAVNPTPRVVQQQPHQQPTPQNPLSIPQQNSENLAPSLVGNPAPQDNVQQQPPQQPTPQNPFPMHQQNVAAPSVNNFIFFGSQDIRAVLYSILVNQAHANN